MAGKLSPENLKLRKKILQDILYLTKEEQKSLKNQFINIKGSVDETQKLKDLHEDIVNNIQEEVSEQRNLNQELMDSVGLESSLNSSLQKRIQATKNLISLSGKINDIRSGDASVSKKGIKDLQNNLKLQQNRLKKQISLAAAAGEETYHLEQSLKASKEMEGKLGKIEKTYKKTQGQIGLMGGALEGVGGILDKLGFKQFSETLGVSDAIEETHKLAQAADEAGEEFSAIGHFTKSMGKNIMSALSPMNLFQTAAGFILDAMFEMDKAAGDYAKTMNVTYEQGVDRVSQMREMALIQNNMMVNQNDLLETEMEINKALGTNVQLNKEQLMTFSSLRESAGFTNEELMGIQSLSFANGKVFKKNADTILTSAKRMNNKHKIYINEKKVLKDIGKLNKSLLVIYNHQNRDLGGTVARVQQLGMNFAQLEKSASALLDFEQSIEAELTAELLTGKDLSLEKARQYALDNDMKGLAEEINKNVGSSAEFAKMNRIQQEAIASAVGMGREELAETLYMQDQLKGLSKQEAERREKIYQRRVAEVGEMQAKREMETMTTEEMEKQASNQERFQKLIEKLKLTLSNILEGPMKGMLKSISNFLQDGEKMKKAFEAVKTTVKAIGAIWALNVAANIAKSVIGLGRMVVKMASLAAEAIAYAAAWAIANPLGAAAGLVLAGSAIALIASIDDGMIGPGGEPILSTKKGAIQLNKDDSMIVGTNLDGSKSAPSAGVNAPQVVEQVDLTPLLEKIDKLIDTNIEGFNANVRAEFGIA